MKYRNVVEVEAYQLSSGTRLPISKSLCESAWFYDSNGESELYVWVAGKLMAQCAQKGDWIIKHPHDGLSIMAPGTFAATYSAIEEAPENRPLRGTELSRSWSAKRSDLNYE